MTTIIITTKGRRELKKIQEEWDHIKYEKYHQKKLAIEKLCNKIKQRKSNNKDDKSSLKKYLQRQEKLKEQKLIEKKEKIELENSLNNSLKRSKTPRSRLGSKNQRKTFNQSHSHPAAAG